MVSPSFVTLVFLVCLQTVLLSTVSNCAKTISMYWNTTNSIFRIDNTDHIIDVNKNNAAFEYDQVNIICPVYLPGRYDDETEKYIIYNVSKEEYETCRITNASPRVIAVCDKPHKMMYFTITFRPFTPQPGGLEFLPGHDYFFISTSSKEDLHRRIGGRCSTHNMKVVFKVCCGNETTGGTSSSGSSRNNSVTVTSSTAPSSSTSNGIGGAGGSAPVPPPSVLKGSDREKFYPGVNVHHHQPASASPTMPHAPPPPGGYMPHPHQPQQPTYNEAPSAPPAPKTSVPPRKKNKEYSDHPNEVVKNEELTLNGVGAIKRPSSLAHRCLVVATSALTLAIGYLVPALTRR